MDKKLGAGFIGVAIVIGAAIEAGRVSTAPEVNPPADVALIRQGINLLKPQPSVGEAISEMPVFAAQ